MSSRTASLPKEPDVRIEQADQETRRALTARGKARRDALRQAIRLNPYALEARYLLGISYLQAGASSRAKDVFDELAELLPTHTSIKFYRTAAIIQKSRGRDLPKAEALLKELEKEVPLNLGLAMCLFELGLRRRKNPPPMTDVITWLNQIRLSRKNVQLVADKCVKFFMERDVAADGDALLAWLEERWLPEYPAEPLLTVLPYLHHIRYWPRDRWLAELQSQIFDEKTSDLICLFLFEATRKNAQGRPFPEDQQLAELRSLVEQLPGVSSLAYNYLMLLNNVAKEHLLLSGKAEKAIELWRECSRLDPFNTLVQFNLALTQARQGQMRDYYVHWHQALRLAYWRWRIGGNRSDWELCIARAMATADKLHEEIKAEWDKTDVPPAKIRAWLKYLDVYAILQQMTFVHPRHQLGLAEESPAREARGMAHQWELTLDDWERRNQLGAGKKFGAHLPSELIAAARDLVQDAATSRRRKMPADEPAAFKAYCEQRAHQAQNIFFASARLADQHRFTEAQALVDWLLSMPLETLEPPLQGIKIETGEEKIPISDLINEEELAIRKITYAASLLQFLAEEGDDPELIRRLAELDQLPWHQTEEPDKMRRSVREQVTFSLLDESVFEAIEDDRWADVISPIEAALSRLPDQLDLLYLAALAHFRHVETQIAAEPEAVSWSKALSQLKQASDYCERARRAASKNDVKARMGNLPDAISDALKVATEMNSPRGRALRRARSLIDQEDWNPAYKELNKLSSNDRNAEVEFYLGLCIYRQIEASFAGRHPSLSRIKRQLKKAADHLRSARSRRPEDNLKQAIDDLSGVVSDLLEQIEYAQIKESAESLMEKGRWDQAYKELAKASDSDAGLLFYMALCRFRGVIEAFEQSTPYSRPSTSRSIRRLEDALSHVRHAKRICKSSNLENPIKDLEKAIRDNLNILKTM